MSILLCSQQQDREFNMSYERGTNACRFSFADSDIACYHSVGDIGLTREGDTVAEHFLTAGARE